MSAGASAKAEGRTEERLDLAIDRAVREMLDVEPPAGLRGRVLDRIGALSTNPVASAFPGLSERLRVKGRRNVWWIAGPVAAAALLVLAVLAPWRQTAQPVPTAPVIAKVEPQIVAPPIEAPAPIVPARGVSKPPGSASASVRQSTERPMEDRMITATVASADDNASVGIDPLAPLAPISVAAVRSADITQKELAISPLPAIAQLQIPTLSPPDGRQ